MDKEEKEKNFKLAEKLLSGQNFTAAVLAGAIATVLAAVACFIVISVLPIAYGFAIAGVGIVVGFFVGFLGRGISLKFYALAATYTIIGCLLPSLFAAVISKGGTTLASSVEVLKDMSFPELAQSLVSGLSLLHLFYLFIAVFAAVFLARRPLSRQQRLAIGLYELEN